ncbi:flavin reductase family protein [Effusibacillus pohliae]|uniref:flavin reductase family protein n=1 Tax=Effusibacillus pohliae TaxID=232270 RepID=UPI000380CCFA|nr:flavin reductase family protein [Effusibacillus pohliae]
MLLDPNHLTDLEVYKLLIGLVAPRPIAFVTTLDENGVVNAAPFSFFNALCSDPPLLSISVGRKEGGAYKDTSRNIRRTGEFVVHVTEERLIELINHTSCPYPPGISEVERAGLHTLPSVKVHVPRVAECRVAMECRLHQVLELGNGPDTDLIIGEVVCFHIDDAVIENGKIKLAELGPVGRLAGTEYTKLGERFSLERPTYRGD